MKNKMYKFNVICVKKHDKTEVFKVAPQVKSSPARRYSILCELCSKKPCLENYGFHSHEC